MRLAHYLSLIEGSTELQAVKATVYHGSPQQGIKQFDPDKRGSNTGAKDARHGYFFFGQKRSAEGYLGHDEVFTPKADAIYKKLRAEEGQYGAAFKQKLDNILKQGGVDPESVDLSNFSWKLRLPRDIRDVVQEFLGQDVDYHQYKQRKRALSELFNNTDNYMMTMNGAIYTCEITMNHAYVADMDGGAYTAERYGEVIRFAKTNFDPDGLVLHNVYDSEVGLRDTVYIVFNHEQIEIVDQKLYDEVPAKGRRFF